MIVLFFSSSVLPGDHETKVDCKQKIQEIRTKLGEGGIEKPNQDEIKRVQSGELPLKECCIKSSIEGINNKEKQLVLSLNDSKPCFYGTFWYYLFTFFPLLPFIECYKNHILSNTGFKMVLLNKLISIKDTFPLDIHKEQGVIFPDNRIKMISMNNTNQNEALIPDINIEV